MRREKDKLRIPVDEDESSALSRGVSQLSEQCSHKNLVLATLIEQGACGLIHTPLELTIKAKKLLSPPYINAKNTLLVAEQKLAASRIRE